MDTRLLSNIIPKGNLRKVQLNVLKNASNAVMLTAGPYGSNTMILSPDGAPPSYSKDGKKVLGKIKYYGPLESSIVEELHEIVTHVVAEVGDGTTSATRLSYYIFKELSKMESLAWAEYPTHKIIKTFQQVTKDIQDNIIANGRPATTKDVFDICMISTNGNAEVSKTITDIYGKYGKDVYISLGVSSTADHIIKEYDGLSLAKGYPSPAYINADDNKCEIRNASIYYFEDPIDTPEMVGFMSRIIYDNILLPWKNGTGVKDAIPTVIFAPSISRDAQTMLTDIETMMYQGHKLPLLVVSNLNKYSDEIDDIAKLCGAPAIHKYIDPTIQAKDIESGAAPTIETITRFCGGAECVISTNTSTRIINPRLMFSEEKDENGQLVYSDIYKGMIEFLTKAIESAEDDDDDKITLARLKKRLHTIKANMVEYLIGGVSMIDRDAIKDLAEDAILCCRSAINDGIGYGACFEGYSASVLTSVLYEEGSLEYTIANIIKSAYKDMITELYSTAMSTSDAEKEVAASLDKDMPINLRTLQYDGKVLTSIKTDVEILEAIAKVVTIMFTANQALVSDPMMNKYAKEDENKKKKDV